MMNTIFLDLFCLRLPSLVASVTFFESDMEVFSVFILLAVEVSSLSNRAN